MVLAANCLDNDTAIRVAVVGALTITMLALTVYILNE